MVDPDFFHHRINVHLLAKLRANMIYRKINVALKRFHWSSSRALLVKLVLNFYSKFFSYHFVRVTQDIPVKLAGQVPLELT